MLRTLKDLFDSLNAAPPAGSASAGLHQVQLATAVLLVEVMRADASLHGDERRAVLDTLASRFALSADERDRLLELASDTARRSHDLHSFTNVLNEQYTDAQKLAVVEAMWQVAFADGHLAAHEQHILWRVADLLHVPHGAYINAKMRARQAAGVAGP